ncbi:unnamed protein product, partial [Scytosiphon promiscuus]
MALSTILYPHKIRSRHDDDQHVSMWCWARTTDRQAIGQGIPPHGDSSQEVWVIHCYRYPVHRHIHVIPTNFLNCCSSHHTPLVFSPPTHVRIYPTFQQVEKL